MTTTKKIILLIVLGVLLLSVINFLSGTTITINGKQITNVAGYVGVYLGLLVLAVFVILVIPSLFVLAVVLAMLFVVFAVVFFPLMPIAFHLFPGLIFLGIVFLIYKVVRKKK